jgi:hypothetical protein
VSLSCLGWFGGDVRELPEVSRKQRVEPLELNSFVQAEISRQICWNSKSEAKEIKLLTTLKHLHRPYGATVGSRQVSNLKFLQFFTLALR